jgi:O-antigen biosynthesis protein
MLVTTLEYHVLVLLPLLVMTVVFPSLAPLLITGFLVPLVVCSAAAAQADIPVRRKTFWSRPLVALLFLLQPVVRGYARYQGRLSVQRRPLAEYESLDSLSRQVRRLRFHELQYWDEKGVDRICFLRAVMERLDRRDWPNKVDLGWNNYDLEIYGSRWSHLQLITVAEVFGAHKQMIRCRLRTVWTLFSRAVFWGMTGLELLVIGFLAPFFPWLWAVLLTLPLLVWWLHRQQRNMRRLMAVFLDGIARDIGLTKVQSEPLPEAATPAPQVSPSLAFKSTDRPVV